MNGDIEMSGSAVQWRRVAVFPNPPMCLSLKGKWETTKDTKLHENQRVLDVDALIHGVNGK
jgi:hypothetical protein